MTPHSEPNPEEAKREQQLEIVIADYIRSCEGGNPADRDRILDANPELADDLREFFANRERMDQLAAPILVSQCGSGHHMFHRDDSCWILRWPVYSRTKVGRRRDGGSLGRETVPAR